MADEDVKRLELRVQELENELKAARQARPKVEDISPEEIKAFTKVRDALAADIGACGIVRCIVNCLSCISVCVRCIRCQPCIVECTCGPCLLDIEGLSPGQLGGRGRFGGLGD